MIAIKGMPLHQWEVDREVELTCIDIDELHWSNPRMSEAIVTTPETSGAAKIPNELLQSAAAITIYALKGEKVVDKATITVEPRKKPSDYVYEPTKVLKLQDVLDRAETAEKNALEAAEEAERIKNSLDESGVVSYSKTQELTDEEKSRARANINAVDEEHVNIKVEEMSYLFTDSFLPENYVSYDYFNNTYMPQHYSLADRVDKTVRYDASQELTDEEKSRARENISAIDKKYVDDNTNDLMIYLSTALPNMYATKAELDGYADKENILSHINQALSKVFPTAPNLQTAIEQTYKNQESIGELENTYVSKNSLLDWIDIKLGQDYPDLPNLTNGLRQIDLNKAEINALQKAIGDINSILSSLTDVEVNANE